MDTRPENWERGGGRLFERGAYFKFILFEGGGGGANSRGDANSKI